MNIVRSPRVAIPTFKYLDDIVTILGGTKLSFYPFLTAIGTDISPYGSGTDGVVGTSSDETGVKAVESEFDPIPLVGGVYGLYFDNSGKDHIWCADNAAYSFAAAAFSAGAWIMPTEALGSARSIIAKYGSTANLEEYDFRFDTSGNLELELHDASASTKETATGAADVVVPWAWNFVVCTFDGTEATPAVHLYRNAVDQNATGATTETGAYVGMEDLAAIFMIGGRDAVATVAQGFEGYIALPFITGKELTAAEVAGLYGIGKKLIGLE